MFEVNQGLNIQMLHFKNLLMGIFLSYKFLDCFLRNYGIVVIHPIMNTTLLTSSLCPAALSVTSIHCNFFVSLFCWRHFKWKINVMLTIHVTQMKWGEPWCTHTGMYVTTTRWEQLLDTWTVVEIIPVLLIIKHITSHMWHEMEKAKNRFSRALLTIFKY